MGKSMFKVLLINVLVYERHVCKHTHTYIYIDIHTYMHIYVYIVYMCMCVCMYILIIHYQKHFVIFLSMTYYDSQDLPPSRPGGWLWMWTWMDTFPRRALACQALSNRKELEERWRDFPYDYGAYPLVI